VITVRRNNDRGRTNLVWLDSRHTFSFDEYYDPAYMGFGPLRVINEDRVTPGAGFPRHSHRDMEILSYVLEGALEHKDSLGTGSIIRPGEVQRMSAGTGIQHSEFNSSKHDPLHFLQIWLLPERKGIAPGYEQKRFVLDEGKGLRLVASGEGRDSALTVHQDVEVYAGRLVEDEMVKHELRAERLGWLQVARGNIALNGLTLSAGDGAAFQDETEVTLRAGATAEVLLFDMAPMIDASVRPSAKRMFFRQT
jgi:redox-sensitive bicupin YhaK (pirin superfamily)